MGKYKLKKGPHDTFLVKYKQIIKKKISFLISKNKENNIRQKKIDNYITKFKNQNL